MRPSTSTPVEPSRDAFARRQKKLQMVAWGATLLPLVAFAYLLSQAMDMRTQVEAEQSKLDRLQGEVSELERKKAQLEVDLESARSSAKHYRDFAGVRIQFYRESDREVVETALSNLGFNLDTNLGTSQLIDREPNTIAHGRLVSEGDLRDIAIALVEAGFPLRRIAPAVRQPDPKLIQIYASAASDQSCELLNVEQIREGMTCGLQSR